MKAIQGALFLFFSLFIAPISFVYADAVVEYSKEIALKVESKFKEGDLLLTYLPNTGYGGGIQVFRILSVEVAPANVVGAIQKDLYVARAKVNPIILEGSTPKGSYQFENEVSCYDPTVGSEDYSKQDISLNYSFFQKGKSSEFLLLADAVNFKYPYGRVPGNLIFNKQTMKNITQCIKAADSRSNE